MFNLGDKFRTHGRGMYDTFIITEKVKTSAEKFYTLQNIILKYTIEYISEDVLKTQYIQLKKK